MTTITEDYVSFETAKLLKERGFDGHSIITTYDKDAANAYIKELQEKHLPYSSDDLKLKEFYYTMPTIQMAMKWLREVHNICITIYPDKGKGYEAVLYDVKDDVEIILQSFGIFGTHIFENSYEQACESAIKYCLKNLV